MAQSPLNSRPRDELAESNLREWTLKARMISRENTKSRRFSSSYIRSFREDSRSFRSNITISSSTASSPGYNLRDEIDPSTYSFTTALRALQARSVNTWECLSPEGFALNSKWNEAEKYICNPLSGEVPMECLSAKTLSGRSFRNLTNRITMSAPLIYPSHSRFIPTTPCFSTYDDDQEHQIHNIPIKEKKVGNMTRDVGVQSTPTDLTSSSATPPSSPQTVRSTNKLNSEAGGNSPSSTPKVIFMEEEGETKETSDAKEETKGEEEELDARKKTGGGKQQGNMWKCRREGECLSLRSLWMRRRRRHEREDKPKPKAIPRMKKKNIFPFPC